MGLLGKIIGLSTNSGPSIGQGIPPSLIGHVLGMLGNSQSGGLGGLVGQLQAGGLGSAVNSWVGKGPNQPVSPDQITKAMGPGQLEQIAAKLGLPVGQVAGHLSQFLPQIINHLTPNGQVPDHSAVESAIGMLRGKLLG